MKNLQFVLLTLSLVLILGCSSHWDNPTAPLGEVNAGIQGGGSHQLWGLWQFSIDRENDSLDISPLREAGFHLNALPFLEPPVLKNLTLESLQFDGNLIDCEIGLRHPFLGLDQFMGFDVCGILISNGSKAGYTDPDILAPGQDNLRLLNPDGYSRWWNPVEFPVNNGTMFGYTDGLLGTPDSAAGFSATLNGYKYFCNDLNDPGSPVNDVDPEGRGLFSAGTKLVRRYLIDMGNDGLVFNYAVDASWEFPNGAQPWHVPDDFGPGANRPEAWNVSLHTIENTLFNDGEENGGELSLDVLVYDWFNPDINTVRIESPGNLTTTETSTPIDGGPGYSTYSIDFTEATPSQEEIELFITVECEVSGYGGLLPGKKQAMYWFADIPVDDESPGGDPEDPIIVKSVPAGAFDVALSGNYAYTVRYGLYIVDISSPEDAAVVKTVSLPGGYGIAVSNGYAYVAGGFTGGDFHVVDIDPPEDAYLVHTVNTPGDAFRVAVSGDYAYVADGMAGLQVIDIGTVGSESIVCGVGTPSQAFDVFVEGDYAYVADLAGGLRIMDISTPESTSEIKAVDIAPIARGVAVSEGYAYIGSYSDGLQIIDVDPIPSAYLVKGLLLEHSAYHLATQGHYAYVADGYAGLQIVDISNPEEAYIFSKVDTPLLAIDVAVQDNYAYVADGDGGGMQIVKLW